MNDIQVKLHRDYWRGNIISKYDICNIKLYVAAGKLVATEKSRLKFTFHHGNTFDPGIRERRVNTGGASLLWRLGKYCVQV